MILGVRQPHWDSVFSGLLYIGIIIMFGSSTLLDHGAQQPALFVLFIALIMLLFYRSSRLSLAQIDWVVISALSLPFISPIITMLIHAGYDLSELDNPSRYLAALVVYLSVRASNIDLSVVRLSFFAGAIVCFVVAINEVGVFGEGGRAGGALRQPISFGNIAMIFGVLCLMFAWAERRCLIGVVFLGAGLCGVLASIYSQSRGGWIFLVVLVALPLVFSRHVRIIPRLVIAIATLSALGFLVKSSVPSVGLRLDEAVRGFACWIQEGVVCDGGVSIRLEMFTVAFHYFHEAPLFGHGLNAASQMIERAKNEGLIDPATHAFGHLHNEFLELLLNSGLVGLGLYCAHLLMFGWLGLQLFYKARVRVDAEAGAVIVFVVVGQIIMGMSQVMLGHASTTTVYAMLLAVCGGVVVNRLVVQDQRVAATPDKSDVRIDR